MDKLLAICDMKDSELSELLASIDQRIGTLTEIKKQALTVVEQRSVRRLQ